MPESSVKQKVWVQQSDAARVSVGKLPTNQMSRLPPQSSHCGKWICHFVVVCGLCAFLQAEDQDSASRKTTGKPEMASLPPVSPPDMNLIKREKPWVNS